MKSMSYSFSVADLLLELPFAVFFVPSSCFLSSASILSVPFISSLSEAPRFPFPLTPLDDDFATFDVELELDSAVSWTGNFAAGRVVRRGRPSIDICIVVILWSERRNTY